MSHSPFNVLFLCTGNSARSILAEGLLRGLGGDRFQAYSAGSTPKGEVHPLALATLSSFSLPSDGYRSKSWDEFAAPGAPKMDFIITVCDNAAGEVCPVWPGQPMTAHWGIADPAAYEGTEEERRKAFQDAARVLKRRLELFLSLPIDRLDAMSLQTELRGIGKTQE
ncbi:arsenate reductase ArsC [Achromobacter sp. Bel]|uniref:arsenate reductase ArsC n=1 Tax=Achromobacter sp. Bel TaxID=2727415 RepID=UPI00145E3D73|nr:arsenate reductase ArsC [Achromobacter sp. Bel]NMK46481.1 arsenate reductase ArsC [Achromobacter sp. Bel]